MADETLGTLDEVVVTAAPAQTKNSMQEFMGQDFLKSSQFIFRLPLVPFNFNNIPLSNFSLFCESVEFAGKSVGAFDFKMPGKNRIKVPYTKEFQDVTCTYLHNRSIKVYDFFSTWINYISGPNTSIDNRYFDEVTTSFNLIQYSDMSSTTRKLGGLSGLLNTVDTLNKSLLDSSKLFNITDIGQRFINRVNNTQGSPNREQIYDVKFVNAYPISFASMQSNWADDNYHRLSVTWTYEYYVIDELNII